MFENQVIVGVQQEMFSMLDHVQRLLHSASDDKS